MSNMGMGPFNGNDKLKGVTDAVRGVLNQGKPQVDLPDNITPEHVSSAADDVRSNAMTLQDRNKIITQHLRDNMGGQQITNGNVAAFANEVQKRLNSPK